MNSDFFEVLTDHIEKRTSDVTISEELCLLMKSHQLLPILHYQTKDASLRQDYLQAVSTYTIRKVLFSQIKEAFFDIPFFSVKGLIIAAFYPVPQLRTMGDCDIIVHEEDMEKAKQRLVSIGFKYRETKWDCGELHFEKQGLDFELHHHLLYDEVVNTEEEKALTNTVWNYVHDHELDNNFHFVFLLVHLKKHLLNCGVGFRQFMDLVVMNKNASLDSSIIADLLNRAGLMRFAGVCSALCTHWFGISLPVEKVEISDEFFTYATDTILSNGVFGFSNPNNKEKDILNSVGKQGKFGSVIHKFFPSYKGCAGTLKYKWIKGKPYLMPILWMYRPFEFLFSGRINEGLERISVVAGSDNALAEREKTLSAWGL